MNIVFDTPRLLILLVFLLPVAWLVIRGQLRRRRLLAELQGHGPDRRWSGTGVLLCTLLLAASLLLSAAGPRWQTDRGGENQTAGFVFMVDVSRSMAARNDCNANTRLDRARLIMSRTVDALPGAQFGFAAFAGLAFVVGEPAYERSYLMDVIHNGIFIEVIPFPGSDIANALHVFLEKKNTPPAIFADIDNIVLFSDGDLDEENARAIAELTPLLAENGVAVTTVGIGSGRGMPVPTLDQARVCMPGQFERADGKEFYTHLVEAPLQSLATGTGGAYFHESSQDELLHHLSLLMVDGVAPPRAGRDITHYFLLSGLLSLFGLLILRYS